MSSECYMHSGMLEALTATTSWFAIIKLFDLWMLVLSQKRRLDVFSLDKLEITLCAVLPVEMKAVARWKMLRHI